MLAPWAALLVALFGISTAAPLARLAGVDGVTAAWWRLLVGSLVTLAASAIVGRLPRSSVAVRSLPAGVLLAAHLALWLESLRHASVASSTGIVVSYPVIAAAYEALVERSATPRMVLGVVLGFSGVAILSTPWAGATMLGALMAFSAAVAATAYFLLGRRLRVRGVSTLEYTAVVYTAAFLAVAVYAAAAGVKAWSPPRGSIPYLIALGLVPMLLGHTMLNYALAFYPTAVVTSIALLEPYGASLLAWLLLDEPPPPASLPGLLLTVTGAWLTLYRTQPGSTARKLGSL
ncbi:conserved archaeal protein [Hyperthermus butylicus DSM 5456]|uniref:Conserved archaeal protein n=1 Tax=Hyperthermus butylicus (strain DSM 5456 / JCM 9403 / PLM1-5) TaxID=415426 RepID=A2BJB0_HYPBU|nr:conserved archaeal protein [Hyperthermus butylicus DSM 5456]